MTDSVEEVICEPDMDKTNKSEPTLCRTDTNRDIKALQVNYLNPWMARFPRNEILRRHHLFKFTRSLWTEVIPFDMTIRVQPAGEHNIVLTMATYKQFLLIGMGKGQVLEYDLGTMKLVRPYQVDVSIGVKQIITNKKKNRFFAIASNNFVEYSYYNDMEYFRFKSSSFIRDVLYDSLPILIVDVEGWVYKYKADDETELRVEPIGRLFENINYIQELQSENFEIYEKARPCIVRNGSGIAIVNLEIKALQKLSVFRKELLTPNPEDNLIIRCYEDKFFFTVLDSMILFLSSKIYVAKLDDIGRNSTTTYFRTRGLVVRMDFYENLLVTITRSSHVEIFDAKNYTKKYEIDCGYVISSAVVVRDMLLVGSIDGEIVIQTLMIKDETCLRCRRALLYEPCALKRCVHFKPLEFHNL